MSSPSDIRACLRCGRRRLVHTRNTRTRSVLCMDCLYATSGPLPLVVDEPTPCYRNPVFFELEAKVENATETGGNAGRRLARLVEREAEPMCGKCPLTAACIQRMAGGRYTGVAGGRLVVNGRVRASRDGRKKAAA